MSKKKGICILTALSVLLLSACGEPKTAEVPQSSAPAEAAQETVKPEETPQTVNAENETLSEPEETVTEFFADTSGADVPTDEDGFFGVWTSADPDYDKAVEAAKKLYDSGYESYVCYGPEWENITAEPYFCVTAGRFMSEEEAEAALDTVKSAGYTDAYIKHTGKRYYTTVQYYNFGDADTEVTDDYVYLNGITVELMNTWYPGFDEVDNQYTMSLVIDANTVFDASCETSFFGNYQEGDSPLEWFQRNYELLQTDADAYMENGPALSGVFEVGINGGHIDRFFGSYWWD